MTSATRNRTHYTLQDDNDFPIRPTFLLPQVDSQDLRSNTDSDGDDFCSRRAHPRCVSQPQSRPSPPTATSDQGASVSNLASSTYAPSGDTFRVQVGADSGDSPRVPPGLGLDDDLATYCTALNLCESSSWPIDEDFAVIGSSGSLQHLTPATQDPNVARLSLSTLSFLGTVGRGGYGKVLLADAASSTRVAVKVLSKAGLTRDDAQEVKTEVRMLRMLSAMDDSCLGSAFTQRMHAAFQTKEHVFVILEFHCASLSHLAVRSQLRLRPELRIHHPLRQTLPNSASLPIAFPSCSSLSTPYDEALNTLRLLSAELLLGILFLHAQGIVHQDIKPANVVVSTDGHAVITDFGSARFLPASRYSSREEDTPDFSCNAARPQMKTRAPFGSIVLCADDQVSYTERYAAPELLHAPPGLEGRNILVYDERVDFYSLGAMLRELALGFVVENIRAQTGIRDCANDRAERQSSLEVDVEFTDFCEQLLSRDPAQRLHGIMAMEHPFLDPVRELWDDIAALRYPPFTEVVWPEVEQDTRLDLRVYDGDDSFETDDNVNLWLEAVDDIPFDVYQPVCEECSKPEPLVESPTWIEAAATPEPMHELCASSTDGPIALPSLSLLPTIPSLDSSSPGSVKKLHTRRESSILAPYPLDPAPPASGRKSVPLRRRQVVHDLRLAFQLSSDPSYAGPPRPTRSAARMGRKAKLGMRKATAAKQAQGTAAAPLSFEHEITIALLATMGGKNVHAPVATLRCPLSPAYVSRCDVRRRGKVQSILRALKGLVF